MIGRRSPDRAPIAPPGVSAARSATRRCSSGIVPQPGARQSTWPEATAEMQHVVVRLVEAGEQRLPGEVHDPRAGCGEGVHIARLPDRDDPVAPNEDGLRLRMHGVHRHDGSIDKERVVQWHRQLPSRSAYRAIQSRWRVIFCQWIGFDEIRRAGLWGGSPFLRPARRAGIAVSSCDKDCLRSADDYSRSGPQGGRPRRAPRRSSRR